MFRLSKVTDYGIVLLAHLAQSEEQSAHNARDIAGDVGLPVPMVSKILKALARHGVLESQRGSKGGYQLARRPEQLTVADMISALEGPVGPRCPASYLQTHKDCLFLLDEAAASGLKRSH